MYTHTSCIFFFFFFNDTATTEIYTLSLHDALPICLHEPESHVGVQQAFCFESIFCSSYKLHPLHQFRVKRSEEHTSELQSRPHLVCRLLLEKKKKQSIKRPHFRLSELL